MKIFDLNSTPLQQGRTLIEASAGTGKTYTLAALFARLLIEKGLSIDEILVCTFTEAATAELRERIRQMLREAIQVFRGGVAVDFHFLEPLAAQCQERLPDLEAALRNIDQAAIFTIHGFCQRLLQDRAFESGMLVETEVLPDESNLQIAILEDFWRCRAQGEDAWLNRLFLAHYVTPSQLQLIVGKILGRPEVHLPDNGLGVAEAGANWRAVFDSAGATWRKSARDIIALLENVTWGKDPFSNLVKVRKFMLEVAQVFSPEGIFPRGMKVFAVLAQSNLEAFKRVKTAESSIPRHLFFDLCERMVEAGNDYLEAMVVAAVHWTRSELIRRKAQSRLIGYNDMLSDLDRVLDSATPEAVTRLRGRWRAALIDEFQDTDPMQERIFRRLFDRKQHWIYLIGDPKQAIYGFRGADLQTYLRAARDCDAAWSLGTNHRSEPALVGAVNMLFGVRKEPFGTAEIRFAPVAARKPSVAALRIDGEIEAPLELWVADEKSTAEKVEETLIASVAAETKRLLESDTQIDGKRLLPGDIAVLTINNLQTVQTQAALQALGIPAVVRSGVNVFQTCEAADFTRLLSALVNPRRERFLRTALASRFFGWSADAIFALSADEAAWNDWSQKFQNWHRMWLERGFMTMLQDLMRAAETRRRILRTWGGERVLTNLLHLGELLHGATLTGFAAPAALLQWFEEHRLLSESNEAWEQRLETDSAAVQILTSHSSKGLEYPVVFVPFAWKGLPPLKKNEPLLWHRGDQLQCIIREEGREVAVQEVQEELLREKLRLLYVAVTRAKQRCYLAVNAGNLSPTSAVYRLLEIGGEVSPSTLNTQFSRCAAIRITAPPSPTLDRYTPVLEMSKSLRPWSFAGEIRRDWRIASFSSLSHNETNEEPDRDRLFPTPVVLEELTDAAALPPGTALGLCLHEIFENVDFSDQTEWTSTIRKSLHRGLLFSTEIEATIFRMLDRVVEALDLRNVGRSNRFAELEFQLPLSLVTPQILKEICSGATAPVDWERLHFSQVHGMLKGFIDLIFQRNGKFWLLDWKSNFLASTPSGYNQATLRSAMQRSQYGLQYLLYCVALRRFLIGRVPGFVWDRDFGGVQYVFLRGVDPVAPGQGVFEDCPTETLLVALDALFL